MMNLAKWKPWNWFKDEEPSATPAATARSHEEQSLLPVLQLQRDMDRLFDGLLKGFSPAFGSLVKGMPRMDISETAEFYQFEVDLPGMGVEDLTVNVHERTLQIRGERKREAAADQRQDHKIERIYGLFERLISLPDDADEDGVKAEFRNGVLSITVKKLARNTRRNQGKQIEIQAS